MPASEEQEMESWRILLFARNGTEMLAFRGTSGFRLPELRIPRWQRTAPNLNTEAKRVWQLDTVALFPLDPAHENEAVPEFKYHVMEVCQPEALSRIAPKCLNVSDLKPDSFADPRDFLAVRRAMRLENTSSEVPLGAFSEFGSFEKLCDWVRAQLHAVGLHWNGTLYQLQANASFALIRFQTEREAVWFKAVGHPNVHELLITTTLAARFPEYLPKILATHDASNGWLMREAEGISLFQNEKVSDWKKAVISLAELQIASVPRTDEILSAGARDLRVHRLRNQSDSFFALMKHLMRQQEKASPPALSDAALDQLQRDLNCVFLQLDSFDIPDALGNLDCNPANVIVSPSECIFLDWAEATIGNPFLNFQHFLEFFRQLSPHDPQAEALLTDVYSAKWEAILERTAIRELLNLTPAIAAFAHATNLVGRREARKSAEPQIDATLRSLTRRIQREIEQLRATEVLS